MCFSQQTPQAPNYKPDYTPANSQVAVTETVKDAKTNTGDGGQILSTAPPAAAKSGANTNFLKM